MIRNDRQYKISRTRAEHFASLISARKEQSQDDWSDLEMQAVCSQLDDLRGEIKEYEELRAGKVKHLEMDSLEGLPMALVKARIAAGLTQKDLAKRLGMREQQIQRYEQNEYAGVSIDRIRKVIAALDISVKPKVVLPVSARAIRNLEGRLNEVGIDKALVDNRLLPSASMRMTKESQFDGLVQRLSRVYGWNRDRLVTGEALSLPTQALQQARFKLPSKIDQRRLNGYCIYAHYIALLALQATPQLHAVRELSAQWNGVRSDIVKGFGRVDLETVLDYLWRLGIVVVPLFDVGLFHGACWRVSGRNVIVLKQRTKAPSRWLVDVLHEYCHLASTSLRDVSVIEPTEGQDATAEFEGDEAEATDFAADVLLKGRADELAAICQKEAAGKVERLKGVVLRVAERENVDVGVLANYIAYRLLENGINWWGTATNLQPLGPEPNDLVRTKLLDNVNLDALNEIDRDLFLTALRPLEETLSGTHN